jgi:hypothetical protein
MVLAIVVSAMVAAPRARAADSDAQVNAAKRACLVGDVDKGIAILADLYMSSNDPAHLYNQARCYEQNGRNGPATARFKEYLRKAKGLSPAEIDEIHKRIDELEGRAPAPPRVQAAPTVVAPAPRPLSPAPPLAARKSAPDVDLTHTVVPPAPRSEPVYKQWWFWTGIGALVVGGVVTTLLLTQKSAPKSPACDEGITCIPQ